MSLCPLCLSDQTQAAHERPTVFQGKNFSYRGCLSCRSLYVHPVPSTDDLALMYAYDHYHSQFYQDHPDIQNTAPASLTLLCRYLHHGKLLDIGCGMGHYLHSAATAGFSPCGSELDINLIHRLRQISPYEIIAAQDLHHPRFQAYFDVIHLGDLLEHMTHPHSFLKHISMLLKPKGYLLIEGPLENNRTLALSFFKIYKWIQRKIKTRAVDHHVPYHLTLMTAVGFQKILSQNNFHILEQKIHESPWPWYSSQSPKTAKTWLKWLLAQTSIRWSKTSWAQKRQWGNRVVALTQLQ